MTPTLGSNRHWATGSWCCLWVRVWDRAAMRTLAGFPPEDASPRPWAPRERRCSSGWLRLHLASPPSSPRRSRLAGCHLWGEEEDSTAHPLPTVAALNCFFKKDLTGQGLIICLFNIQQPSLLQHKGMEIRRHLCFKKPCSDESGAKKNRRHGPAC